MFQNIRKELELTKRHLKVLEKIIEYQPIGVPKLSGLLGLQPHQVKYSLKVLQQNSIIQPTKNGAVFNKLPDNLKEELNEIKNLVREIEEYLDNIIKKL